MASAKVFSQDSIYNRYIAEAERHYNAKAHSKAAQAYTNAFVTLGNKGYPNDRYNAACAWALAGSADSAFEQLFKIATKANYNNLVRMSIDPDLNLLRKDKRWQALYTLIKLNKDKAEVSLNKPLVAMLDSIYMNDQEERLQLETIENKFGRDSKTPIMLTNDELKLG